MINLFFLRRAHQHPVPGETARDHRVGPGAFDEGPDRLPPTCLLSVVSGTWARGGAVCPSAQKSVQSSESGLCKQDWVLISPVSLGCHAAHVEGAQRSGLVRVYNAE